MLMNNIEAILNSYGDKNILVANDIAYNYTECIAYINEVRESLSKSKSRIVGIDIERSAYLVFAIFACWMEKKAFFIFEKNIPAKRRSYYVENSKINEVITFDSGFNLEVTGPSICNGIDDRICQIIYTSGSTGNPKGVKLTYNNFDNFYNEVKYEFKTNRSSVLISSASVNFDMFISEIITSLARISSIVMLNDEQYKNPVSLLNTIKKYKNQTILTTPSKLKMLMESSELEKDAFENILLGGEKLESRLVEKINKDFECNLYNLYGPTEATCHCFKNKVKNPDDIYLGKPVINSSYMVVDDSGYEVSHGEGELVILGESVSDGYLNMDSDRFLTIDGVNRYYTNDIVHIDLDKNIKYVGRNNNVIKINGQRINLSEIKNAVDELKLIKTSSVQYHDNEIVMFYESDENLDISEVIIAHLKSYIYDFMIPKKIIKVDAFKLTSNGKIDEAYLLQYLKGLDVEVESTNDEDLISDNEIYMLTSKVLNKKVNINKSFNGNGGDSLLAMKLMLLLKQKKIDINIKRIIKANTIKELIDQPDIKSVTSNLCEEELILELNPMQRNIVQNNTNVDNFLTNSLMKLNRSVSIEDMYKLINGFLKRYDIFKYYYDSDAALLKVKQKNSIEIFEYLLDDNCDFDHEIEKIYQIEKNKLFGVDEETIGACKIEYEGDTYLMLLVHHFYIDAFSWNLIYLELDYAINNNMIFEDNKSGSYVEYMSNLNKYSKSKEHETIINYFESELKDFDELLVSTNRYSSQSYNLEHFSFALDKGKSFSESAFSAIVSKTLFDIGHKKTKLFEIEDNGRQFNDSYYYNNVGWFTSPYNVIVEYKPELTLIENSSILENVIKNQKKHSVDFSINKSRNYQTSLLTSDAKYVVNYLGEIKDEKLSFYIMDTLNKKTKMDENIYVKFEMYFVAYRHENKLEISIYYNKDLYSSEYVNQFSKKLNGNVNVFL